MLRMFCQAGVCSQLAMETSFVFPDFSRVMIPLSAKRAAILCVLSLLTPISAFMYFCRYFPSWDFKTDRNWLSSSVNVFATLAYGVTELWEAEFPIQFSSVGWVTCILLNGRKYVKPPILITASTIKTANPTPPIEFELNRCSRN